MIGIIGGTGLYAMEGLRVQEQRPIATPFGAPSSPVTLGELAGRPVAFLARHGLAHEFLPSEVNYRANIWALKSLGARTVIGVSAVGSLRESLHPGELALPSQFLDFTRGVRPASFFGNGLVAHISTAQPTCTRTADLVARSARELAVTLHTGQTYACVEGPRLGTRAESFFLRGAGADLVGMTNVPEAFLAGEAQLCYCSIAVITDYDSWLEDPAQHVTVDQVLSNFRESLSRVQALLTHAVRGHIEEENRPCRRLLQGAIVTARERMTAEQRALVDFLSR